jgi:CheY-like chemotaxis protein
MSKSAMIHPPILYAEDTPDDVFFMRHAFAQAGMLSPLVVVKDGQQAIDYLAGKGAFAGRQEYPLPCLLLLDLGLPIKCGWEVLEWVRKHSTLKSLKVVVVSASALQSDIDVAKIMGAIDYVVKPNPPTDLVEILRERKELWLGPS